MRAPSAVRTGGRSICGSPCASAPPTRATLRTRGFDSRFIVRVTTDNRSAISRSCSTSLSVAMAPIRNSPPPVTVMREYSGSMRCRQTRRVGWNTPAFIISISAVPPATARMVGSFGSSNATASLSEAGSTMSNGITEGVSRQIFSFPGPANSEEACLGGELDHSRVRRVETPAPFMHASYTWRLYLARTHAPGAGDHRERNDPRRDRKPDAGRGDRRRGGPADRRKSLGEGRKARRHLATAKLAALGLAAEPELDRRRRHGGNDNADTGDQRMPRRGDREHRNQRRENHGNNPENRLDLGAHDETRRDRCR